MKPLVLVTAKELDPITSSFLNARFTSFMVRFIEENGLETSRAISIARDILRDADIPQPGDELLQSEKPIDLSPFNI
jgi:retron-type reverse transcriptase